MTLIAGHLELWGCCQEEKLDEAMNAVRLRAWEWRERFADG